MEIRKIGEKAVALLKKLNKKVFISAAAVIVLGGAVLLNLLLVPDSGKTEKKGTLSTAVDLSDVSAAVASKENEAKSSADKSEDGDMISQMTLSRKQARDEAMEVLNAVADSDTAIESMKEEALAEIKQIAKDIENEANIESLVRSKGFTECVAVVNGESASIVVKTDGLMENQVAQISEIVYEQSGVIPGNLKIIESK